MDDLIDQLISVVAEEAEQCERLLTLLRQQQRYLVEGNVAGLDANVRDQEEAITRSRALGMERGRLLETLGQDPNLRGQRLDISRLIASLSNDYGRRLETLRGSMKRSIELMTKTREQNAMLIQRSLSTIGETMRLLAAAHGAPEYAGGPVSGKAATVPVAVDRMV
ncbi:MAG: flagellar protein FlgN [Candidatus Zixiibacteriota bacterium]